MQSLFDLRKYWNTELMCSKSEKGIMALWQEHGQNFSSVNISTAIYSFPQNDMTQLGERCITEMALQYIRMSTSMRIRDAANVVHSLGQKQFKSVEARQARAEVYEVVKQKAKHEPNFLEKADCRQLCLLLHGYAYPGAKGDDFFSVADEVVQKTALKTETANLVQLAAAYSRKNRRNEALFEQIEQRVLHDPQSFSITDRAHLVYAFSTLELGSDRFYQVLFALFLEEKELLDAKALCHCLDAYRSKKQNLPLAHALHDIILERSLQLTPRELSLLLNAYIKCRSPDDLFLDAIEKRVIKLLPKCNSIDICLFATLFAKESGSTRAFFAQLEIAANREICLFSPNMIVMLYHAFCIRGIDTPKFYAELENRLTFCQLENKDVVIMMWSMLLRGSRNTQLLAALLKILNSACNANGLDTSDKNRHKLIEIASVLQYEHTELYDDLNKNVCRLIEISKSERNGIEPDRSTLQQEVEASFKRVGIAFEAEAFLDGFKVDIFIPDKNIVVEVNGKPHYYRKEPTTLNATSLMKQRILSHKGYEVIWVPHFNWPKTCTKQDAFTKRIFKKCICM